MEAVSRLLAAYSARCVDDPDFVLRIRLHDFIDPMVVRIVASQDLLQEFSEEARQAKVRALNVEADRRARLVRAWKAPRLSLVQ
jgi:hypothetical protein